MSDLIEVLPKATKNFAAAIAADPVDRPLLQKKVHEAEQLADEQLSAFVTQVGDTFITPFDREDLLNIAERFDDAFDALDYTVDLLVQFELDNLPKQFTECAMSLNEMAELTVTAASIIKKPKKFRKIWDDVSELENRMDGLHSQLVVEILSGKYEVFRALQMKEIADHVEHTANLIDTFVFSIAATAIKET
jgi:uncharacterized protein Yka (UPF0111/DUF47 family)